MPPRKTTSKPEWEQPDEAEDVVEAEPVRPPRPEVTSAAKTASKAEAAAEAEVPVAGSPPAEYTPEILGRLASALTGNAAVTSAFEDIMAEMAFWSGRSVMPSTSRWSQ